MGGTTGRESEQELVRALIDVREAIGLLVEDLRRGHQPQVERWLDFVELLGRVVALCRQQAVPAPHGQGSEGRPV